MLLDIHVRIKDALRGAIRSQWNIDPPEVILNQTPKIELGEFATPVSFELARQVKKAPRMIAGELIARTGKIDGVERMEVAGAGYINIFLDRAAAIRGSRLRGFATDPGKVIVEHTNINPNKAAHIGHLRNAKKTLDDVRRIIADSTVKFDYYCWDVYARVTPFYESNDPKHNLRAQTLKEIEEGDNDTARMAEAVAMTIARCHLRTMARINVHYDLLPRESDILHLKFWDYAFRQLREREAILLETKGKNKGCWVMRLETDSNDEDKIIVRSNGTVTYVGKDIAYQLWKLGLLDQDFKYDPFTEEQDVWVTTSSGGRPDHPAFGRGETVYNVIDVRQSYLQNVVRQGLLGLGYEEQARRSIHFSYEVVALSPACAEQLGIEISPEDRKRPHIEVSGRKGQGVKADDLLDTLESEARNEVGKRNPELKPAETDEIAHQIAVGALRYFLLKFTRTAIIAFDFKEALNFDGETGPYLQYATVRGNNIINKLRELEPNFDFDRVHKLLHDPKFAVFLNEAND
ncbi:MAG: arginine--tRNA ligase, partial [Acidobacteria bacterium]